MQCCALQLGVTMLDGAVQCCPGLRNTGTLLCCAALCCAVPCYSVPRCAVLQRGPDWLFRLSMGLCLSAKGDTRSDAFLLLPALVEVMSTLLAE